MSWPLQVALVLACGALAALGLGWVVVQMLGVATIAALIFARRGAAKAWAVHDALERLPSRARAEGVADLEAALWAVGVQKARGQIIVVHVVSRLVELHQYELADSWRVRIRSSELPAGWQAIHANAGVEIALWAGKVDGARRALAGVTRPAEAEAWEALLAAQELLLDALEGAPAIEPRVRLALLRTGEEDRWRGVLCTAHAHALARLARIDAATAALRALEPGYLLRASRQRGPASELARQLYASKN